MVRIFFSLLILIFALASCNTDPSEKEITQEIEDIKNGNQEEPLQIEPGSVENIIENISSPIEMAALIKDNDVPFSLHYLSSPEDIDRYKTNFDKALKLGILGADLGYLNIYSRTSSIVSYTSAIKKIADDLRVGQFFDFATLKRLATNNENLDSIMYISVSSFNRMDEHLRENNRSNLSVLMITGVWVEGMYLATQVVKEKPNKQIIERIGEQKIILNELVLLLKNYEDDPNFAKLVKDFEDIRDAYSDIRIEYKVGEPKRIEKDGRLIIEQTEESIVHINDEQLKEISNKVERVRNKLTFIK